MLRLITSVFLGLLAAMSVAHAGEAFARAYQQATQFSEQGRYADAQETMKAGLELASDPEEAFSGWKLMAKLYEKQDKPKEALDAYTRASEQQILLVQQQAQAIERANQAVEASKQQIEALNAEQAALEQQLKEHGDDR